MLSVDSGLICPLLTMVSVNVVQYPQNDFTDFEPALQIAREAGLKVTVHCGKL